MLKQHSTIQKKQKKDICNTVNTHKSASATGAPKLEDLKVDHILHLESANMKS